jgi:hypothetical protein
VRSLLTDVRDFVTRHRAHGQLTADAASPGQTVSRPNRLLGLEEENRDCLIAADL